MVLGWTGHAAIIHAATVEDSSLIGMGATLLDGVKVRNNPHAVSVSFQCIHTLAFCSLACGEKERSLDIEMASHFGTSL